MDKNWFRMTLLFIFYIESLFFDFFFTRKNELQIKQDLMHWIH